ncbi:Holliday junction branch migration protein RuvA [Caldovatus aquaticus]|uniref:Holliday junction branch migration complex subunit RuvA n=1 Tax=Caldovatus aquaticus TaxID=2865671 RepID=A0ABS7F363_9PROT|nr:Holliday junction branch migration protein RuvA [Caldovatus aquaticus]MBW8270047.1 Holliday junction branch migration protein RuvA [Caldovatus aquaticus]
MIGKLTGRLDGVVEGGCILDVGGVGYLLSCSSRTIAALPPPPATGTVLVETQVREDAIVLYGFAEESERACFRALTRVQGVGPTLALAVLSALSPDELAQAIRTGDKASLGRAKGVGPKLASRLLTELRDWAGAQARGRGPGIGAGGPAGPEMAPGVEADAVSALLNLGWKRPEAAAAVARAIGRLGEDAPLASVIRDSLKELSNR